ncbi:non-ribosomal peptide synthetase [Clostridium botulinum]|uniref:non-ribosomal peptide synthetase n=1 Tax=Clostridium botulinum TaxID=1491 RepID=UPI001E5D04B7|nr:non-ribosomal peptide synthetase [Clostridium botulinum]MCC5438880.1 amino acid adenylation domain-containing protein [Clostridium botulinum]NFR57732.1 amino acid adenylation domain-containing protein [Clostridium botulinum]
MINKINKDAIIIANQFSREREYWVQKLSGELSKSFFPVDFVKSSTWENKKNISGFKITGDLFSKLSKLSNGSDARLHMILSTIVTILINKYTSNEDVIIGTPIYKQDGQGEFLNTVLILRNEINGNSTFKELLLNVRQNLTEAIEHENYPIGKLLSDLDKGYNEDYSFFDILVMLENVHDRSYIKNIKANTIFSFTRKSDCIQGILEYNDTLYKIETIERIITHFLNLLKVALNNIDVLIKEMEIVTEEERNQILHEFNDTKTDYPRDKTIQELFEDQVEKAPDNIAVVFEDKKLTYRELNEKANSLARVLRNKGIKADSIVGIMMEKSLETIIGLMGILKAGGAYLPIDPSYPKERIEYMLKDSKSNILLTTENLLNNIEFTGQFIDLLDEGIFENKKDNLEDINTSNDLSYVIYTSGTTGKPKGVMCEHRNIVRLVKNTNYISFKDGDKILQTGSIVFDASTFEIWAALLNGLELYLAKSETIILSDFLEEFIDKNNITILWLTSELFNQIAEKNVKVFKKLRYLLVGGDVLSIKYINLVRRECKNLKIINGYGPTENTTFSTAHLIEKEYISNIPIGKPIANSKAYIVDRDFNIMPTGIYGELCVSGEGVAKGYLNKPELTLEKFIENPFEPGTKMYKTGDLARWLPDGDIEFLGRMDNQVKIRGFRIELEEIENELLKHEEIKEAIVVAKENEYNGKYTCAYIVCEKKVDALNIRNYLKENLPEYMIPSYFVQLEKMPLTINGKIDRKSLPEPNKNVDINEYEAPRNEVEEKLSKIWSEVLGIEKVGINNNFFDLGGHSLKATVLIHKIHKKLNVEVPLKELFKKPTIKKLSEFIENAEKNPYVRIEKVEEKEYYEASPSQKRMYMIQQLDLESTAYNMPIIMTVEGNLDKGKIEEIFQVLIQRHEVLRTSFEIKDEVIIQKIDKKINFKVQYIEKEDRKIKDIIKEFVKKFDLSKAPLLRVGIVRLEEEQHILMIDMHHIISDGVSMRIFMDEFIRLYKGEELGELRIRYRDYSEWQDKFLKSDKMKSQKEYWINRLSDGIPMLNMPTDYIRPAVQCFEGDNIKFKLGKQLTSALNRLAKNTGTTLYMVLLSGINILLSKYSGQEDIIVGTPISGRTHADLEKVMGMFVNTLAMRNYPAPDKSYKEFLGEVKENTLKAHENQNYQFEELIDDLNIHRDLSRNPIFDVMFTLENMDLVEIELKDLVFKSYNKEYEMIKFDLDFTANKINEDIVINLGYNIKLFKREKVERIIQHFKNILKSVTSDANIKISEVEMLDEIEVNRLVYDFNNNSINYPKDKTIHELFEEQVERTPENIAVIFQDKKLTYSELNRKANKLARNLKSKGVGSDTIVGILVEPSLEMIVGIIGVLKAGAAYLSIDVNYPDDRVKYMIEDSKIRIVLTQPNQIDRMNFNGEILDLTDEKIYRYESGNLGKVNNSKDLAYVIYTSGSTGKPKGVLVEHRNLVAYVFAFLGEVSLNEGDTVLQQATYCFDGFIEEIYPAIITGGKFVIVNKYDALDMERLEKIINKYQINLITCSPLFLNEVNKCKHIESVHTFISGGDVIKQEYISNIKDYAKVYNSYGPTETTVCACYYKYKDSNDLNISIGKPIANYKVYILDKNKKLVPIGVVGELYIAGDGVARGYLNNKSLTSEKFIQSPFEIGEIMYKTGDLAKWGQDSNIEFLGRIDNQVKINGFRIEMGEIESELLRYNSIEEAIVIDREDENGYKYLCAYVVSNEELAAREVRKYLSKNLPAYMIPSYFIQLEKMPLSPNGKLDKGKLPEPDVKSNLSAMYQEPNNKTQEVLVKIWEKNLGIQGIGIYDNFFELGGNSIKMIKIISNINSYFNIQLSIKELYENKIIAELSSVIEKSSNTCGNSLFPKTVADIKNINEPFPLTDIQLAYLIGRGSEYEIGGISTRGYWDFETKIDIHLFNEAVNKVIQRHPMLRAVILENGTQKFLEQVPTYDIEIKDLRYNNSSEQKKYIEKERETISNKTFKTEQWPLFEIKALRLSEDVHRVFVSVDIIICDGTSFKILFNEILHYYNNMKEELPELKFTFRDYMIAYNKLKQSDLYTRSKEYWLSKLEDFPSSPILQLKQDPKYVKNPHFKTKKFILDKSKWNRIKKLASKNNVTPSALLCTIFAEILAFWSNQPYMAINLTVFNRYDFFEDVNKLVGDFTSTMLLDIDVSCGGETLEKAKNVQSLLLRALENRYYEGTEFIKEIIKYKNLDINKAIMPIVFTSAIFNDSNNYNSNELINSIYNDEDVVTFSQTSQVYLDCQISEDKGSLVIAWDYVSDLFEEDIIDRMFKQYTRALMEIENSIKYRLNVSEKDIELIEKYNDTDQSFVPSTLHEMFINQAKLTPNNNAIAHNGRYLTYQELDDMSNQVALFLLNNGVKANDMVGISAERNFNSIINILGVLKVGAGYVPIDPGFPADRKEYIIKNSNCIMVLDSNTDLSKCSEYSYDVVNYSKDLDSIAYIIYTSGSTGTPKGVVTTHKAAFNTINDINLRFNINEDDRIIGLSSICFDLSVYDIFGSLSTGATLVIVDDRRDTNNVFKIIEQEKITIWNSVPAIMDMFVNELDINYKNCTLRAVLLSGDWIPLKLASEIKKHFTSTTVTSLGGATEVSIWSIYYPISNIKDEWRSIPYGMPLANQKIYILNYKQEVCPIGVQGEIFIGGIGLAKGYMNDIEKTKAAFIKHDNLGWLYRTGDIGKLHKEGYIEFFGRIDHQVKIRGYRIELGEIEKCLLDFPQIESAIVIDRIDSKGSKYLCAYFVSDIEISSYELRKHLEMKLPSYMIPAHFIRLNQLPLTANGKINKVELNNYPIPINKIKQVDKPTNEIEFKLVEIWKEVLEVNDISINDDFFELGGNSLHIQRIKNRIKKVFGVEVSIKSLFSSHTIKDIAENLFGNMTSSVNSNSTNVLGNSIDVVYYWSPTTQWKLDENRIVINSNSYEGIAPYLFPKLYFKAQSGITIKDIFKDFKDVDREELNNFIKVLIENKVLISGLQSATEIFSTQRMLFKNKYSEEIHYNADVYYQFKNKQLNRAYSIEGMDKVYLTNNYKYPKSISERRSYRKFKENKQIEFETFSALLSTFKHKLVNDEIMYYYASAGGLYPIDIYLYIKEGRVSGIKGGLYYYSPSESSINLLNEEVMNLEAAHYFGNKQIAKSSAFSVFFVYNAEANMPKYDTNGYYYALLDCGIMVGTLTQVAELLNIGLCSIGSLDFSKISKGFNLNENQLLIHTVEAGIKERDSKFDRYNITKQPTKEYYNISSGQKRLFVSNEMNNGGIVYNTPTLLYIKGALDKVVFEDAFKKLVKRHDSLRTSFELIDGKPVQKVHDEVEFKIDYVDFENRSIKELEKEFIKPFDLSSAPLFRVSLIRASENLHVLCYDMHHIITDRYSSRIILREFYQLYCGRVLPEIDIQYKDFSEWQNELFKNGGMKKQEDYWLDLFKNEAPVLNMPTDYQRPIYKSYEGDSIKFKLDSKKTKELRKICKANGATMYMTLLTTFNILLSKYTGQEDITIGSPTAGREHIELESVVGMFVNTLAMRNYPKGEKSFINFLKEVKDNSLKAYENQDYPFEELVNKLEIKRNMSRHPIFDVMFILQENWGDEDQLDKLQMQPYEIDHTAAEFDMTMEAIELRDTIEITLEYCTKLFKKKTIENIIRHYTNIIDAIILNPKIRISDINILSQEEENQILNEFNNTAASFPIHKTIHEIFQEQVEQRPYEIAVTFEDKYVTYSQLNENANKLARYLRRNGVERNSIVGIMVERSIEMITSVLAVLKAGGAYLPIDPEYPEERIKYMLEDSKANILITQNHLVDRFKYNGKAINIDEDKWSSFDSSNLESINTSEDLVYVIYTSGTTANPKGVMIQHRNLINATYTWREHYNLIKYPVRLLQMASIAFDVFAGDLCRSLLNGGTMYICANEVKSDFYLLYKTIEKYRINIFESTPSLIIPFMKYVSDNNLNIETVKLLILGSDNCPMEEYRKLVDLYGNYIRIINSYGLTEATIDSSYYEEKLDDIPQISNTPIGKPLHNTKFYVLNNLLKLQPVGVYGELYIGGDGVANGYINRPELTEEKFINNPFILDQKMYKTGDLARWLPDGNMEFLGRIDNQVKIRGFRIEIGEIENLLLAHKAIREAVIIDRDDKNGTKYLCAYITTLEDVSIDELKSYLLDKLPDYMIPSYFIKLEKIPLTSNGKVDRKALPKPDRSIATCTEYVAPTNDIEESILELWMEVLDLESIGVNDDFFELGGNSLSMITINSKLKERIGKNISIATLFRYSTISSLAKYIMQNKSN